MFRSALPKWMMIAGVTILLLAVATSFATDDEKDKEQQPEAPKVATLDEPAPPFTLNDHEGRSRSLADYKGRIVVLEWTEPECPFVTRQYNDKSMQRTREQVRKLDGTVAWLAICSTPGVTDQRLKFWAQQHKIDFPLLIDYNGAVAKTYKAERVPGMFVIDKEGVLRYHGAIDDNRLGTKQPDDVVNYVVNAVGQLVKNEPVSPDHVKAYGCTLKLK
jgi:peroxiredoxin